MSDIPISNVNRLAPSQTLSDTGWLAFAGTGSFTEEQFGAGNAPWTSLDRLLVEDAILASTVLLSGSLTYLIKAQELAGDPIPAGATVVGVEVQVKRFSSTGTSDEVVMLIKDGALAGGNKAGDSPPKIDVPEEFSTFGGRADMWGISLTPEDVNSANFGVGFQQTGGAFSTYQYDVIQMKVYYLP